MNPKHVFFLLSHLGVANVCRVGLYRLLLKLGYYQRRKLAALPASGPFFQPSDNAVEAPRLSESSAERIHAAAAKRLAGTFSYFGWHEHDFKGAPDWNFSPFTNQRFDGNEKHWSQISDFNTGVGDIKVLWELSRFGWALDLAQSYALSRDIRSLGKLNELLDDWAHKNPLGYGPQWKCGQETSIRLLTLLECARVLHAHNAPSARLISFILTHASRVAQTLSYAVGQQNNHIVSEATALFVAGNWLSVYLTSDLTSDHPHLLKQARKWASNGRYWLERSARDLILADGTFSQYSIVYHRVLIDTLVRAELWRREMKLPGFSPEFMSRAWASVDWLCAFTDPLSGEVPNAGANDGAHLYDLPKLGYRDFRPSIQSASVLFKGSPAYAPGDGDDVLSWWGIALDPASESSVAPPLRQSLRFPTGGYRTFSHGKFWAYIRYPQFDFRPSQADLLHFDLWANGHNILRDSGTYSYNPGASEDAANLGTVQGHNTVQIDGRDQMPRWSRFLYGEWPRSLNISSQITDRDDFECAYRDSQGAFHARKIEFTSDNQGSRWIITDILNNIEKMAVLRWRLAPGSWTLQGKALKGALEQDCDIEISFRSDSILSLELESGWESRHYLKKTRVPVIEVGIAGPSARIVTEIKC